MVFFIISVSAVHQMCPEEKTIFRITNTDPAYFATPQFIDNDYMRFANNEDCRCRAEASSSGYSVAAELFYVELEKEVIIYKDGQTERICDDYVNFNNDGK